MTLEIPAQPPHQPVAPALFARTTKFAVGISGLFALCHFTVFRRKPGFHTLALSRVLPVAFLLLAWNILLIIVIDDYLAHFVRWASLGFIEPPWVYIPDAPELRILAVVMFVCACVKRRLAWRAFFREGGGWHTYSNGISYLCYVLPWVRRDWVNRFVEPALFGFAGYELYQTDYSALGVWLMISAVSVWWSEQKQVEWILASQFSRHNTRSLELMQAELLSGIHKSMQRGPGLHVRLRSFAHHAVVAAAKFREASQGDSTHAAAELQSARAGLVHQLRHRVSDQNDSAAKG